MSRRSQIQKREVIPDAKYHSVTISRFVSKLMMQGQKRTAEAILYGALDLLEKKVNRDPVEALEQAIKNATPLLQVKARRVGGATYQVPVEVQPDRGLFLALSWLISSSRSRKGKTMAERLADELAEAYQNQGNTIKKREDTHRMAEANRAFAHYRW
jgi:small subunit ribosomal protein S7